MQRILNRGLTAPFIALSLLVLAGLSLTIGVADFDPWRMNSQDWQLLWISRLPRTLALILAGTSLAVAGALMQALARNAFVEPGTTGAMDAALLAILVMQLWLPGLPLMAKMFVSSLCALAASLVLLRMLASLKLSSPVMVPLIGIMFGSVIGAITTFLAYRHNMLQSLSNWSQGDFSAVLQGRYELLWFTAGLTLICYLFAQRFTLMSLGESVSTSLGLPYKALMLLGLVIISLVAGLTVTTVGMLPFIGLMVPNLVRLQQGDNLATSLPWVAAYGALLLLVCDILARVIRFPYEIPLASILGILGGSFFIYLLLRRRDGQP